MIGEGLAGGGYVTYHSVVCGKVYSRNGHSVAAISVAGYVSDLQAMWLYPLLFAWLKRDV